MMLRSNLANGILFLLFTASLVGQEPPKKVKFQENDTNTHDDNEIAERIDPCVICKEKFMVSEKPIMLACEHYIHLECAHILIHKKPCPHPQCGNGEESIFHK